ncbi:hypothetical protein K8I28_14490 [bacterium]|nr:hypothetical protein [bacterium]
MKKILTVFLTLILVNVVCHPGMNAMAQVADDVAYLENLYTVYGPTAGILKKGQYQVEMTAYGDGGLNAGLGVGLFDRFMIGVSFGGTGLIGYNEPKGNKLPGVEARYRIWDESLNMPAVSVGFVMQGHGNWYEDENRYLYKAPGLYAAASKNWVAMGGNEMGVHAAVTYNTIETDDQQAIDGVLGADFMLNDQLALAVEYDFAFDDNLEEEGVQRFGSPGLGYLNAGARFTFAQAFKIEFNFIDILRTSNEIDGVGREIRLTYIETFTLN